MTCGCVSLPTQDRITLVETLAKVVLDRLGRLLTRREPRSKRGRDQCGGLTTWDRHALLDPAGIDVDGLMRDTWSHIFGTEGPTDDYETALYGDVLAIVEAHIRLRSRFDHDLLMRILTAGGSADTGRHPGLIQQRSSRHR